jgi:hypothetical protein
MHRSASTFGHSSRLPTGKLPKMNFLKFEGENPKMWQSRCESYFDMYEVDYSIWVKVASMHFEGPAAPWLQSVEDRVKSGQNYVAGYTIDLAGIIMNSSLGSYTKLNKLNQFSTT